MSSNVRAIMAMPGIKPDGFLGVRSLAATVMVSSLLCAVAHFSRTRVSVGLGVWCEYWEMLGPIFCLFMSGLLVVAFFRTGRRQALVFGLGMGFGITAFAAWTYALIYH